jgi:drug/metabolite transporter (DMT)-like permease
VVLIPLAQVFALEFTSPIWVMLAAPLLLGERFTRWKVLAVALGFAGMLLIVKPGFTEIGPGTLWAFSCAFGFAGTIIATKRLSATETPFCVLFYMTLMQTPIGMAVLGGLPSLPPDAGVWFWTVALALGGLSSHYCLTRAYKLADATVVVPLDFTRLPLIAVVGLIAYNEAIDVAVILGGALIVFGNLMNIRAERARRKREAAP